jgi:O-antigen/teichoic acid export membrane protein
MTLVSPGPGASGIVLRRNLSQVLLSRAVLLAVNITTGIITARVLHPTGRGELAAMIIGPLVLSGVTNLGLPTALIFHLGQRDADRRALVVAALGLSALAGAIAAVLGWLVMPYWLVHHPPSIVSMAQWFVLLTPVYTLVLTGRAVWEADGRFSFSSTSAVLSAAATLALLVALAMTGNLTSTRAAGAYVLTGLLPLAWVVMSLWFRYKPRLDGVRNVSGQLVTYGLRSYGADVCGTLSQYIDQALVVMLLRPDAMGIYVVALSLSRVLHTLHSSIVTVLFPRLIDLPADEIVAKTARAARFSTLISMAAGVVLALVGPALLGAVYGPGYVEGAVLLALLIGEAVVSGLTFVLMQALLAFNRPGVATVLQVVGLATTVPLLLVLVPAFGLEGAGMALLGSSLLRVTVALVSYPAILGVPIPRLWMSRSEVVTLARRATS